MMTILAICLFLLCWAFLPVLLVFSLIALSLSIWLRHRRPSKKDHSSPYEGGNEQKSFVVGFFHPYCNAGGGGERVLWTAIRALQQSYPQVRCVIYSGDCESTPGEILAKARQRFNITLLREDRDHLQFVYLKWRWMVEAAYSPGFTLLGQSLGSVFLGMEALWKFVPDLYIDSMGYAFTLPLFKYLAGCRVACYVHYPTISTDMLERVSKRLKAHNNAGLVSRSPVLTQAKLVYYRWFARLYGWAGGCSDSAMVNSSWTKGHISTLWKLHPEKIKLVYPPCDTEEFSKISRKGGVGNSIVSVWRQWTFSIVSVSQFRPEKDHRLQISAFSEFIGTRSKGERGEYRLILAGSVRNEEDLTRVKELRSYCREMGVEESVDFKLNISFEELKDLLAEATIGLHTMWNEHFGIGVVECMAAGTIVLAHNSGGPKMDIVTEWRGSRTGYLAEDATSYARSMDEIFNLTADERSAIRENARESVARFSEAKFKEGFLRALDNLITELLEST